MLHKHRFLFCTRIGPQIIIGLRNNNVFIDRQVTKFLHSPVRPTDLQTLNAFSLTAPKMKRAFIAGKLPRQRHQMSHVLKDTSNNFNECTDTVSVRLAPPQRH